MQAESLETSAGQDPGERIDVIVVVRSRTQIPREVVPFQHLTRAEFVTRHGASPDDLGAVAAFAAKHGLTVTGTSSARRSVFLSGACSDFASAFRVEIARDQQGFSGPPIEPDALADVIELIVGMRDVPVTGRAGPQPPLQGPLANTGVHLATADDLDRMNLGSTAELAKFYGFPDLDGAGQCVGVIELGGGYHKQDLDQHFGPASKIDCTDVCVGEGANQPCDAHFLSAFAQWIEGKGPNKYAAKPTVEVTMDVSLLGSLVPKSKLLVYFGEDTERGLVDILQTAIFESDPQPDVLSISWGFQEREIVSSGGKYVDLAHFLDELFLSAAHMGVTICASSGDYGACNEKEDGLRGEGGCDVEFPASSPYVLACGGTTIVADGSEVVWNSEFPPPTPTTPPTWTKHAASGGGFSTLFERPAWQEKIHANKGRGVPDVATVADPRCGPRFVVGGASIPAGGTSAAAPIWAALVARCNQALGQRVGFLNPILYALVAAEPDLLNDVTRGDNRYRPSDSACWKASEGWDPCTGWGTPRGEKLVSALRVALAGSPRV